MGFPIKLTRIGARCARSRQLWGGRSRPAGADDTRTSVGGMGCSSRPFNDPSPRSGSTMTTTPLWWQWPCEQIACWSDRPSSSGLDGTSASVAEAWVTVSGAHVAASTVEARTNRARNDASSAAIQACLTEENPMTSHNTACLQCNRVIVAVRHMWIKRPSSPNHFAVP